MLGVIFPLKALLKEQVWGKSTYPPFFVHFLSWLLVGLKNILKEITFPTSEYDGDFPAALLQSSTLGNRANISLLKAHQHKVQCFVAG